jgi:DNA-directed RNA polymerase specialized sigma24 family protein
MKTATLSRFPSRRTTRRRRRSIRPIRPRVKMKAEDRKYDDTEPEAAAFAARDAVAIETLLERYRPGMVKLARYWLVRRAGYRDQVHTADAEDIVQACYMHIWRCRNRKSHYSLENKPVLVWLRGCLWRTFTRIKVREHAKKRGGGHFTTSLDSLKKEPSGGRDPAAIAELREVHSLIAGMKDSIRTTVELHLQGYTFCEIGERDGITKQGAHHNYRRGLKTLAECLAGKGGAA